MYIKCIIHLFYVCVYVWRPEVIFWEWVLSLHPVDLGAELKLLGLGAGVFTS